MNEMSQIKQQMVKTKDELSKSEIVSHRVTHLAERMDLVEKVNLESGDKFSSISITNDDLIKKIQANNSLI